MASWKSLFSIFVCRFEPSSCLLLHPHNCRPKGSSHPDQSHSSVIWVDVGRSQYVAIPARMASDQSYNFSMEMAAQKVQCCSRVIVDPVEWTQVIDFQLAMISAVWQNHSVRYKTETHDEFVTGRMHDQELSTMLAEDAGHFVGLQTPWYT